MEKDAKQREINARMSTYLQAVIKELHKVEGGTKTISVSTEIEPLQPAGFLYNVKISVQLTQNAQ